MDSFEQIKQGGIIAVLRDLNLKYVLEVAEALRDSGINVLEITMETPNAISIIKTIKKEMGESIVVGAGTVLDSETARTAIMAGAQFIFSPTVNAETIRMSNRYGVVSIPGALTPTEILSAYENGADAVKIFPIRELGPSYLKDIKGPLPHIPLVPTGGVELANVSEYLRVGAVAVGVGGSLVNMSQQNTPGFIMDIKKMASQFVEEVNAYRNEEVKL